MARWTTASLARRLLAAAVAGVAVAAPPAAPARAQAVPVPPAMPSFVWIFGRWAEDCAAERRVVVFRPDEIELPAGAGPLRASVTYATAGDAVTATLGRVWTGPAALTGTAVVARRTGAGIHLSTADAPAGTLLRRC